MLATTSGLPSSVKTPAVMSRACCFSPNEPDVLYSVQSGPRGKAYVTRWRYKVTRSDGQQGQPAGGQGRGQGEQGEQAGDGGVLACVAEPMKVACVSGHPVTAMSLRSDGARLAVGTVEGAVLVYRLPGFAKVG